MFDWLTAKNKTQISISPSIVIFTLAILGGLKFLASISNILLLLLLSFILMVALNPAVTRFQKKLRLPRILSMILVYVLLIVLIVSATALVLPPLVSEIIRFLKTINFPYLQEQLAGMQFSFSEIGNLANQFGSSVQFLLGIITNTFAGFFTFLTLLIMSFYMLIDRPHLHKKVAWFTNRKENLEIAKNFLDDLEVQLGGWVRGQMILMIVIALATYFGLMMLKIPFALPLAILAGTLEILPNLGPFISAVPGVLLAYFTFGLPMAGATIAMYTVIQQLENNFIVPKIMSTNAKVNPLVAMLCVFIGFQLGSVIGGLLAIPVYIILRATYSLFRKKIVQD
ncbi:MAG: AI-2E family transporter [Candidatus Pacebacteria bacterium]|nr:AI-2E family transporter [Candidatus Paceibacterota bacterium]